MAKRERAVAENHGNEIHIQTSNREAKRISGRCYRGSQLSKSGGKMKRLLVLAITLAGLFYFPSPSAAGQGYVTFQSSGVIFKPAPRAGVTPNRPFYRRGYPVSPYSYPPIPLIPPYASACYLPSSVVITSPYLCILHNEAFVSRIGMIDHLAGMHGMPLHRSVPTLQAIVFYRPIKFLLTATFTRFALLG